MKQMYGFSLFEILLVLGITASVTAAGTIGLSQLQSIFKLRGSGDEMRSLIQLGREYSIANMDSASFGITFESEVFKLKKNTDDLSIYQMPSGVTVSPSSFSWNFAPATGKLGTCAPCEITLSSLGNSEVITISENGLVY